jgi:hypothetical protein
MKFSEISSVLNSSSPRMRDDAKRDTIDRLF